MQTLQMSAMPDPARITLNSKTTALMVLDYVEDICATQPKCKSQMLPAMTPFMERVRKAGLVVAYGCVTWAWGRPSFSKSPGVDWRFRALRSWS